MLHGIRGYIRKHRPWSIQFDEQARGDRPPEWLRNWRGDGVIARFENPTIAQAVLSLRIPVVNVSAARIVPGVVCVKTDDQAIARLAAEHLLERGFKNFGYCHVRGFAWSELRRDHFIGAVEGAGHRVHVFSASPSRGRPDPRRQDLIRLRRWIRSLPRPAGVFAAWDGCAVQILNLSNDLGVKVPDDLAVIGVDNDELLCDLATPSLSSVDSDPYAVGYEAASCLDRMMCGKRVDGLLHLVPPLGVEVKRSTDVLAIEDRAIAEAARFIRENATAGINVGDVLKRVPLSRRVLERRFKSFFGVTPHEQISKLKLEKVRELLTFTDLTHGEIAERCGFAHVEYLTVAFKRRFGIAPRRFRNRNQR
jgi:LacI family transcriptional regulator